MNDLSKIFNVQNLADNEIGHLMWVLNSPSYIDVFEPYLRTRRDSLNRLLLDPKPRRQREYTDDFLRGGIIAIDELLSFFGKLIAETEMDKIHTAQMEPSSAERYEIQRVKGEVHPMTIGTYRNNEGPDYDPDEDY